MMDSENLEILLEKEEIIQIIKKYLITIDSISYYRKSEKVEILIELFNFLSKDQIINNFIDKHLQFKKVTISKALEVRKESPSLLKICNKYLDKIGYLDLQI